jgi:hypothetical protein
LSHGRSLSLDIACRYLLRAVAAKESIAALHKKALTVG